MEIKVRMEQKSDYDTIVSITDIAFKTMPYADGNEHELVKNLHKSEDFIPELSLVAEHKGRVIGHIMFTKAGIIDKNLIHPCLTLAPVSVHPDFQNLGIGSKLIREGLRIAREMGFRSVNVLGHPAYYPRFGFRNAGEYGIKLPFDVPDGAFMCMELQERGLKGISGTVLYAKEFGVS
jgi:predicted N-acetyltransferase YhbS